MWISIRVEQIRYPAEGHVVFNMEWVGTVTWSSNYVDFVMKEDTEFPRYWRLTVKSDGKKFARNDASLETKLVFTIPNWFQSKQ
jgi:hypothetical protein